MSQADAAAATIIPSFWRRLWLHLEAAFEAMSMTYDEIQDLRMARLETELRELKSTVAAMIVRQA